MLPFDRALSSREKLDLIIKVLHYRLTEFIELNDAILKGSATLSSMFHDTPFEEYATKARENAEKWRDLTLWIDETFRKEVYSTLSSEERGVFDAMLDWTRAVSNAASILSENQQLFLETAKNQRKLTLAETRQLTKSLNDAHESYYNRGVELQARYNALQETKTR